MSVYSGRSKIELCQRLLKDWQDLADYFEIPHYERSQFEKGRECQAIWKWLEKKNKLQDLPEALKYIKRKDLLPVLEEGKVSPSDILFYLPDRKPQKDNLKEVIKDYRAQYSDKKQRPLLCLIHGNENEYGNFIKCLLTEFFPKDNTLSEHFRNGLFEIELLFEEEFHTVDKLHQEILDSLEKKVKANEKEAIANKLARERRPIIVHACLLTKDLETWQDQKNIIDGFIEFWANWPKNIYAQHQLFLVFLSFSYESGKNNFSVVNWFRRNKQATNLTLLNKFERLNEKFPTIMDFFKGKKVHAKVLPKLDSVKRKQACNWIKTHENQIKKFWDNTYALEQKVKALYENRNAIPMEELAPKLEQLLTNPDK
ncbi:hypothetical protein [Candidatus Parabeggiatoa sp. HSG14]|uniref:hypothetical protein n=1 Tax=Candidatus Parabeggiatoa sp. HSG14 TaxID=3055593 RepID=UPI0025A8F971|nr:hypothetical protein [Thiotrichales bacterium HSG14]